MVCRMVIKHNFQPVKVRDDGPINMRSHVRCICLVRFIFIDLNSNNGLCWKGNSLALVSGRSCFYLRVLATTITVGYTVMLSTLILSQWEVQNATFSRYSPLLSPAA